MSAFDFTEKAGLNPGVFQAADINVKLIAFFAQNKMQTCLIDDLGLFLKANSANILMTNTNIFLLMIQIFLHHDLLLFFDLLLLVLFILFVLVDGFEAERRQEVRWII